MKKKFTIYFKTVDFEIDIPDGLDKYEEEQLVNEYIDLNEDQLIQETEIYYVEEENIV